MAKHAPGCLFQKVTLWIAAPDYGDPRSEPVTHIIEAVQQYTDLTVLDSASVELHLAPVPEEDN
jgi:hypothetical protein